MLQAITAEELEKRRCCNNTMICSKIPPVFYGAIAIGIILIIMLVTLISLRLMVAIDEVVAMT